MSRYVSDDRVTYDPADLVYLNETDGLRVAPARGVIHRASCRTQEAVQRPVVLPWPEYGVKSDRPCKVCKPDLTERTDT